MDYYSSPTRLYLVTSLAADEAEAESIYSIASLDEEEPRDGLTYFSFGIKMSSSAAVTTARYEYRLETGSPKRTNQKKLMLSSVMPPSLAPQLAFSHSETLDNRDPLTPGVL